MWESCFEKRAEIKPSVKCNSRFGKPALKDKHETTERVVTDFFYPNSSFNLAHIYLLSGDTRGIGSCEARKDFGGNKLRGWERQFSPQ